jgi:predicted DCC family thiol-disulfide oxidoreductase YuxK
MTEIPPDAANVPFAATDMLVIFDGTCGVCSRAVDWISRRVDPARLSSLPNQTPGLLEAAGLSRREVDRAVWLLAPDGRRFSGAAAVNRVLGACPRGPWRLLALLYALPGFRQLEDAAYAWIALHRGRLAFLGAEPACERAGMECESR